MRLKTGAFAIVMCAVTWAGVQAHELGPPGKPPDLCRQWIKWLVDGNENASHFSVSAQSLAKMSQACLGRDPDPKNRWKRAPVE